MAGLRFQLDLFIKETPTGTVIDGVRIPTVLASKIPTIRQAIKDLKAYASNAGNESTIRAVYHKCYHDEEPTRPCEPEKEI
jgi:hypothetical protein